MEKPGRLSPGFIYECKTFHIYNDAHSREANTICHEEEPHGISCSAYNILTEKTYSKQSIVWTTEICGALATAERPQRFFAAGAWQMCSANRRGVKRDCILYVFFCLHYLYFFLFILRNSLKVRFCLSHDHAG